jgi:preprotein translocase subunit SecD
MPSRHSQAATLAALASVLPLALASPGQAASPKAKPGLWFGSIHLCRDTVEQAVAGVDDYGGQPALTLTLSSLLQPRLQRETARRVKRTMAFRLDGEVIQELRVNEPIWGTSLHLSGLTREQAARMRAAALQPC